MGARTIGTLAGAVIGGVIGSFIPVVGTFLGATIGAADDAPAVLPRFHCPPGMGRLLTPLLGLPFALGARDPARGSIDCLGLLLYALREGLGLQLEDNGAGDVVPTKALTCVWSNQRGTAQAPWLKKLQPWDMLLWHDQDADAALRGAGPAPCYLHCALAVNHEALVSATLRNGVAFHYATQIAHDFGAHVLALHRPVGISAWEPVRERGLILR